MIKNKNYIRIKRGKFYWGAKRVKFWGVHIAPGLSVANYEEIDLIVNRIKKMGFNAVGLSGTQQAFYDREAEIFQLPKTHQGDDSQLDRFDYSIYKCKRENIWVWLLTLDRVPYMVDPNLVKPEPKSWIEKIAFVII